MYLIEELENDRILMKNNILVKARYNLSLVENRIFLFMLYKLQRESKGILKCEISHKEFKDIVKFKEKNTVKGILEVLEELRKKPIFFKEKKKNKKGSLWGAYGFINGYYYDDELGSFNIEASEKIHEILKEYLKMGYTPINVQIWLSLNNSYAQRFYDLLRLWSNTKTVITYKVDEIKELLMLEDKYDRYNDFKRRVITPAIKELNNTGYFEIDMKENKIGRKVDSIDFIVKDLDKRKYFSNVKEPKILEVKSEEIFEDNPIINKQKKKEESKVFYIPNKKLFTAKTLDNFKKDFSNYDFKDSTYKKLLQEAILVALEKDDEEKIKVKSYNYFKKTLENKINDIQNKKDKTKSVNTRFHNINQSFNKYNAEELERMLIESQKSKFEVHSNNSSEDIIADNWILDENKIG
ncbi:replication initiation protein [Paraclostridium sordellii]|uniref:Replication initiator protein n=1 Tax=Paraclostridium sordellii TaxID=1505 RepID=A0A9P1KWR1_PARSO|nr:replication initiation protein [Paeniclostridium sordellii]CEN31416.1 putative replication initiator protein [[Clostridium] sordellii] [Paeniclostridium sordellii]